MKDIIAPVPKELLEEWGVVQRYCDRNTNRYSEALIYNPSYIMSETEKNLLDMCRDSWRWQSSNPNGYGE